MHRVAMIMALGTAACLLCWPDYTKPQPAPRTDGVVQILTPTFTGPVGGWSATMPLSNLGQEELFLGARSTDCNPAHTQITIDKQTSRPVRVAALIRHNFSPIKGGDANAPQVRFTVGDDPTFAAYAFRSPWTYVYSAMYAPGSLPSGWNPAWFTGGPTVEDILHYASLSAVVDCGQNYIGRYELWEINDSANGNGYLQLGDAGSYPAYQPRINMKYGAKIYGEDLSTSKGGDTGAEFWTRREIRRVVEFQLENVQSDEALELPFEMQMRLGLSRSLFFCMDPSSPYHMHRLSFPAYLRQLNPVEAAYFGRHSAPITLRERI